MHVAIAPDDARPLTVRPAPDTTPNRADSVTVLLCPPDAYDRQSGTLAHPYTVSAPARKETIGDRQPA